MKKQKIDFSIESFKTFLEDNINLRVKYLHNDKFFNDSSAFDYALYVFITIEYINIYIEFFNSTNTDEFDLRKALSFCHSQYLKKMEVYKK